eukprot:augustus_masked-scaffold_3-processed-gene-18.3-mRNA-1 protein AED:1.00 eAED:1.00 QI:0/0/0/0/1/1/2/0/795
MNSTLSFSRQRSGTKTFFTPLTDKNKLSTPFSGTFSAPRILDETRKPLKFSLSPIGSYSEIDLERRKRIRLQDEAAYNFLKQKNIVEKINSWTENLRRALQKHVRVSVLDAFAENALSIYEILDSVQGNSLSIEKKQEEKKRILSILLFHQDSSGLINPDEFLNNISHQVQIQSLTSGGNNLHYVYNQLQSQIQARSKLEKYFDLGLRAADKEYVFHRLEQLVISGKTMPKFSMDERREDENNFRPKDSEIIMNCMINWLDSSLSQTKNQTGTILGESRRKEGFKNLHFRKINSLFEIKSLQSEGFWGLIQKDDLYKVMVQGELTKAEVEKCLLVRKFKFEGIVHTELKPIQESSCETTAIPRSRCVDFKYKLYSETDLELSNSFFQIIEKFDEIFHGRNEIQGVIFERPAAEVDVESAPELLVELKPKSLKQLLSDLTGKEAMLIFGRSFTFSREPTRSRKLFRSRMNLENEYKSFIVRAKIPFRFLSASELDSMEHLSTVDSCSTFNVTDKHLQKNHFFPLFPSYKPLKEQSNSYTIGLLKHIQTVYGFAIIQIFNKNFLTLTKNYICNLEALNLLAKMQNLIFLATDLTAYAELRKFHVGLKVSYVDTFSPILSKGQNLRYGDSDYFNYMIWRTTFIQQILDNDINLLLTEADAFWRSTPLKNIFSLENDEVVLVDNLPPKKTPNGGFIYIKSTRHTKQMWGEITKRHIQEGGNEQPIENEVINLYHRKGLIRLRWVPHDVVSSGLWYQNPETLSSRNVVILNNWITGTDKKIERAKKFNQWFLDEGKNRCS